MADYNGSDTKFNILFNLHSHLIFLPPLHELIDEEQSNRLTLELPSHFQTV